MDPSSCYRQKGFTEFDFSSVVLRHAPCFFACLIHSYDLFGNLIQSGGLYFQKFEFNASIYYIFRAIGHLISGYNQIQLIGPSLMILALAGIFYIAIKTVDKNVLYSELIVLMIWTYCFYSFLTPTLHPWYVGILVAFSLFTPFRFPIVWSMLIMLTYINYSFDPYVEVLPIVLVEYVIVFFLIIYEIRKYGITGHSPPKGVEIYD